MQSIQYCLIHSKVNLPNGKKLTDKKGKKIDLYVDR